MYCVKLKYTELKTCQAFYLRVVDVNGNYDSNHF